MNLIGILILNKEKTKQKFIKSSINNTIKYEGVFDNVKEINQIIFEKIDFVIIEIDPKNTEKTNKQISILKTKTNKPIIAYLNKKYIDFYDSKLFTNIATLISKPLKTKDICLINFLQFKNNTLDISEKKSTSTSDLFNDITDLLCAFNQEENITEIHKLNQFLKIIIENASVWIAVLDKNRNVVIWNKAAEIITGYSKKEIIGNEKITRLLYPDQNYQTEIQEKIVAIGKSKFQESIEIEIITKDRKKKIINFFNKPIVNKQKQAIGNVCIAYDITPRKQYEAELLDQINENKILLKEINHRVKNNLQLINSLLNLQADTTNDLKFKDLIKETQNRVRTIALIIEELYHSKSFANINVSDLITKLIKDYFNNYSEDSRGVSVNLDLEDLMISIDDTITLGLLVSEIINNSFKFELNQTYQGRLLIKLYRISKDSANLIISDNERKLNNTDDSNESLGIQLIHTLAEQLEANLQINYENGVAYKIEFPVK